MKRAKITIPDMQSEHCRTRVQNALGKLDNTVVHDVQPGTAEVSYSDEAALIKAIQDAGYSVEHIAEVSATGSNLQFKTNINCEGCIARVTPALDAAAGAGNWSVDTAARDKVLTVQGSDAAGITEAVRSAGFRIEKI
ncbi:MAG: cation transporter [Bacteroidia bacterium]|nr:cation transporter [Bacteroidia bacterium]